MEGSVKESNARPLVTIVTPVYNIGFELEESCEINLLIELIFIINKIISRIYSLFFDEKRKKGNFLSQKESIDMLEMLKEKTKGNISPELSRLLDQFLTDLRLNYVDEQKDIN